VVRAGKNHALDRRETGGFRRCIPVDLGITYLTQRRKGAKLKSFFAGFAALREVAPLLATKME